MKTLIIFLLITIPISVSSGFTVDLIHRDSQLSPLYNPANASLQRTFLRSISRSSRLSRRAGFKSKIEADVFGVVSEYAMTFQVGNPPVQVVGEIDTGSDLTWAQCQPCKYCYKQTGPPVLDPLFSSSYQSLSCNSTPCETNQMSCDSNNICNYKTVYVDESYSLGELATETFWFGPTHSFENVVFGCGHDNNGSYSEGASGIVGLGRGPLSLINQLESAIQGKFSYCLIPYLNDNDTTNQTSKLHFGRTETNFTSPNVVSILLVTKDPYNTFYYVTLESISVGNNNSSSTKTTLKNDVHEGNIIVDSGTTLTFLPRDLFSDLSSGLTQAIEGESMEDPWGMFGLCWNVLDLDRVPNVTFQFTGGALEVPPVNMFTEVETGLSCLTIVPTDDLGVVGNLLQRNFLVAFDLVNQEVSFSPTDCTKNMHYV